MNLFPEGVRKPSATKIIGDLEPESHLQAMQRTHVSALPFRFASGHTVGLVTESPRWGCHSPFSATCRAS